MWPTGRQFTNRGQGGNSGGLALELQHHFADRLFEMIGGTIDPQHAVHQDPDPIGHSLDVAQDVRAEKDRPTATLDDLDERLQKITPHDRVEAQGRIVEDQQLRVRGHGQRQRDLRPLAAREPPNATL